MYVSAELNHRSRHLNPRSHQLHSTKEHNVSNDIHYLRMKSYCKWDVIEPIPSIVQLKLEFDLKFGAQYLVRAQLSSFTNFCTKA